MNKMTPTFALILAGGLAAGVGLARPATGDGAAASTAVSTDAAAAPAASQVDAYGRPVTPLPEPNPDDRGSRNGNRTGDRGAAPEDGQVDESPAPVVPVPTATITIQDFAFQAPATAAPGSAITVTNADDAAHTLTFRTGEADTGTVAGGQQTTINAPTAPGTYQFFCQIHPSMEGEIEVGT